ncbi:MAG TPA: hypothetical protein VGM03_12010 [Phycisphaerae bacterium]
MGLSIGYEFRDGSRRAAARRLVRALRARALTLRFDRISEIQELDPADAASGDLEPGGGWLQLCATRYVKHVCAGEELWLDVPPLHAIVFSVHCEGAETGSFGLAMYPTTIAHECAGTPTALPTELGATYSWSTCCKTQYAGLPQHGGIDNFVRAHRALVDLLDAAIDLGLGVKVYDDAGFWKDRDEQKLIHKLNDWNRLIAAFVGTLKDSLGADADGRIAAPIRSHPAFEHLEADALLKRRNRRTKKPPANG